MKKIIIAFTAGLLLGTANIVFAGSPLIQTSFYSAYYLNEKVQIAEQLEFLDGSLATYVADKNVAVDQKLAVINALQWNEKGKNSVETFKMVLGRMYGKSYDNLNMDELTGDELLCLGYMISLDKQRKLTEAIPYLEKAKDKNPTSYITQLIFSMAVAQDYINKSNPCEAWNICNNTRNNTSLKQDFDNEANELIFRAVEVYKAECK
jgi:tetratricopeptide (TPR) repeat protein